jgi:hypothetical protein
MDSKLAAEWQKLNTGSSYFTYKGVLVHSLDQIPEAQDALKRQKALDKLTQEEKELLGLAPKSAPLAPGSKIRGITSGKRGQ